VEFTVGADHGKPLTVVSNSLCKTCGRTGCQKFEKKSVCKDFRQLDSMQYVGGEKAVMYPFGMKHP